MGASLHHALCQGRLLTLLTDGCCRQRKVQWFWEVFPAQDGLTTYMFSYVDPAKGKPAGTCAVPGPCRSLAVQGSMALAAGACMPADAVECSGKAALS